MDNKKIFKNILVEARKRNIKDSSGFNKLKLEILSKYKSNIIPKNASIASLASEKEIELLNSVLMMKPSRTLSGVAPIALMTDPYPCPHTIKDIGPCTYCPGGPGSIFGNVPQSYTGKEPSTRRAIRNNYDPYLGVFNRLEHYIVMRLVPEKVEIILQGGTFNFFPYAYQEYFVKYLFKAMNDFSILFYNDEGIDMKRFNFFFELPANINDNERTKRIQEKLLSIKNLDLSDNDVLRVLIEKFFISNMDSAKEPKSSNGLRTNTKVFDENEFVKSDSNILAMKKLLFKVTMENDVKFNLESMQNLNEHAKIRCVGLTIETKSDFGKLTHGNQMLRLGCTRVELGIQSIYNEVLEKTNRGNSVSDNIESIRVLKDLGFKINAHYMPGLPYTTRDMDKKGLRELFDNEDYRPDMLKIYPCMVLKGTKLYDDYVNGKFVPLSTKEAAELIAWFKQLIPRYCRIMRVQRDIPSNVIDDGVDKTNLRQYIEKELIEKGILCNCIRCREIGHRLKKNSNIDIDNPKIVVLKYKASKGVEFFISYEDLNSNTLFGFCRLRFPSEFLRSEISEKSALLRELHVFGNATSIGKKGDFQHKGIGKKLLLRAEEIASNHGRHKMVVISGIGAREYYRKLGYQREGVYMVKKL